MSEARVLFERLHLPLLSTYTRFSYPSTLGLRARRDESPRSRSLHGRDGREEPRPLHDWSTHAQLLQALPPPSTYTRLLAFCRPLSSTPSSMLALSFLLQLPAFSSLFLFCSPFSSTLFLRLARLFFFLSTVLLRSSVSIQSTAFLQKPCSLQLSHPKRESEESTIPWP